MAKARPGELSPHLIQPGKFEVKYEPTTVSRFNKKVINMTVEILCDEDEYLLSVTTNGKSSSGKNRKDPMTFSLNTFSKEVLLTPYLFNSNNLTTLTKFKISGINTNMGPLHCKSIVQLHRMLASVKEEGTNLFNKQDPSIPTKKCFTWQVVSQEVLYNHQNNLQKVIQARNESSPINRNRSVPSTPPPTYLEAVKRFPMAYFRPEDINTNLTTSISTAPTLPRIVETPLVRSKHDTFLPPYGYPTNYPISLGYGLEVGLGEDVQELFDPSDNSLFYLNHKTNKFYVDDPRLLTHKTSHPISHQIIIPRDALPVIHIPSVSFADTVSAVSQVTQMEALARQRWKQHSGYQINLSGKPGDNGTDGIGCQLGFFGCRGADARFYGGPGHHGQDGKYGANGTDGLAALNGTNSRNFYVSLSGDSERLILTGDVGEPLDMGGGNNQSIMYIKASGGRGGVGGKGGDGGNGGMGGMGGHGHKGTVGIDAMIPGGAGGGGQSGGSGGRGGNGGDGGNGGCGGFGGRGGDGGKVIIASKQPALFALVEVNTLGGKGGKGGNGGKGGQRGEGGIGGGGGDAGRGGMGGPGTDDSTAGFHGSSGKVGLVGVNGKPGSGGRRGPGGSLGENGSVGGVRWVVLGDNNEIISSSSTKFKIEIISDSISLNSAVDDDIFEPSERIGVNGIKIRNTGEIPLPPGAKFRMVSSDTINFEDLYVTLPEINPGVTYQVMETLYGRIFDIPPPNSRGRFLSIATFNTQVDLFNRSVTDPVPRKTIKVQYPITIKSVTYPVMQNRGSSRRLRITLENISGKHYGYSTNSGGYLSLVIHLDRRLMPVGYNGNVDNSDYHIYYDHDIPDSLSVVVKDLLPNSTFVIDLTLFLEDKSEIYDKCLWQVDLMLRQKLIQYESGYVEVSPGRMRTLETGPNDVLLVVSFRLLNRQELCFWESVLTGLGLNIHYWDMSSYNCFETQIVDEEIDPPTNWSEIFRGKLVIFPHADLKRISIPDIVSFFHGSEWRTTNRRNYDSGMFFVMNDNKDDNRIKLVQTFCLANLPPGKTNNHLTEKQAFYQIKTARRGASLYPLCVINPISTLWETKCIIAKYIFSRKDQVFTPTEERDIYICEFPLARSANFYMLGVALPRKENFRYDNPCIEPDFNCVPFGSNLGQTILCVVTTLPTAMKTHLLMTLHSARLPCVCWRLVTPSGFVLDICDLLYMTLVHDFTKEMIHGQSMRFEDFRDTVVNMPGRFTDPHTARCTMAILNRLQVISRDILKNRPEARSHLQNCCVEMETSLREVIDSGTLRTVATEVERTALLNLDVFLDRNIIFSPYEMDSLDGYAK